MRIVDVRWTPVVNMYVVQCECGAKFEHRADRWRATCQKCGASVGVQELRDQDIRFVNMLGKTGDFQDPT